MVAKLKFILGLHGWRFRRFDCDLETLPGDCDLAFAWRNGVIGFALQTGRHVQISKQPCNHNQHQQTTSHCVVDHIWIAVAANCIRRLGQHQLRCTGMQHLSNLPKQLVASDEF